MKKLIVIAILPLTLMSCKDKADKNPVRNIQEATKDHDLQGTWQTSCQAKPVDALVSGLMTALEASVKSVRVQYKFDGANVNRMSLVYNTNDCTGPESYIWNESGKFEIQNKVQVANVGDAKGIDMKFEKVFLTVQDDNGLKVANERKLCGRQNWEVGKSQGVTANSNEANCYGVQVPRTNANIYRIEKPAGDQKWTLAFGVDPTNEAKPGSRPATLSSVKFEKK